MLMPVERLRESSFYQFILEEGRELGRQEWREKHRRAIFGMFRLLAAKRFPGIQLGEELEAVSNLEGLRQVAHELDDLPTPEALRRRLAELADESPRHLCGSFSFLVTPVNHGASETSSE